MFVYQNIQIDWLVSKQIASRFESRRLNSCNYFWNVELAICWRIIPLRRLVAHCLAAFTKKPVSKYKQVSEFTQVVRGYWNQVAPEMNGETTKTHFTLSKNQCFSFLRFFPIGLSSQTDSPNAKGDDPPNFLKVQFQLEIEILYQAAMGHLSPTIHSFQHTEIGILQE